MADKKAAFRKQVELIRKRFADEARLKIQKLEGSWSASHSMARKDLDVLFRHAHNFGGSAASFGLSRFSERARQLEFYVQAMIDSQAEVTAAQAGKVHGLLQQLHTTLLEDVDRPPIVNRDQAEQLSKRRVDAELENRLIFLVEDDKQQAGELATQLGFLGYEVRTFSSPGEVWEQIQENPAAILMDVVFPEGALAGPESIADLTRGRDKGIPTIFMSVRRDFEARLAALRAGGTHYLEKPIDVRRLADVLEEVTRVGPGGPFRVLLVDDEPEQAELHALILEQAGMVTTTVHQPSDVLTILSRFKPDLILMDLYMPDCDGAELASLLRQHDQYAVTPIVFLSSEERFEKKIDAMKVGGEDFLTKPVSAHELVAMVELRANRARQLHRLSSELDSLSRDHQNQKFAFDQHLALMYTDTRGQITYANGVLLRLLGCPLVDLLGTPLQAPLRQKTYPSSLWSKLQSGKVWHGTLRESSIEGEPVWLSMSVSPAKDKDGRIFQYIWVGNDITQHYKQRSDLQHALERGESLLKAKRDLLACTSHEMRSSLNGLIGMAHLLSETRLSREQKEFVDSIDTAAEHLLGVINQTLDFSKIEAGRLELEHVPFNLRRCLEDVGELNAAQAHEKHLELVIQMHPDVPEMVVGDALRLRQVLINLIHNGIKFTQSGEVVLRLFLIQSGGESVTVRFEVQDTGIGISPTQIGRLFQFFTQATPATTRQFGGTGLGLAISSRLVEAMGGQLKVESKEGKGSKFFFEIALPREKTRPPADAGELQGWRVLLICDIEALSRATAQMLEYFGCNFSMVESVDQAITKLAASVNPKPYDSVLLRLHGREDARRLAAELQTHYEQIALIGMARFTRLEMAKQLLSEGFHSYVLLPLRKAALFDELSRPRQAASTRPEYVNSRHEALRGLRARFRILVAEDNPINRRIAMNLLRNSGYQCEQARDGHEALQLCARESFDLVLMDCQMPVLDGFEATRQLRAAATEGSPRLPIIAMTGNTFEDHPQSLDEMGFDAHLIKPIQPAQLFQILDRFLLETLSPRQPQAPASEMPERHPVDLKRFQALTQQDPSLERSLIEMFLVNVSRELQNLTSSLRNEDYITIYQLCHGIKGACLEMGARDLARIAGRLEEAANQGELGNAAALLASLQAEFQQVEAFLGHYAQSRQS